MKYYLDTEFHEYEKNGVNTIELISIGIVAEDGREYYAVCNEFDIHAAMNNDWLRKNVIAPIHSELEPGIKFNEYYGTSGRQIAQWEHLFKSDKTKSRKEIAKEVINFCSINSGYSNFGNLELSNVVFWLNMDEDVDIELKHKGVTKIFNGPIEFYGYYSDYDWVVFCWLFGRMIDLPDGFPMYCIDLKQILDDKASKVTIASTPNDIEYIGVERGLQFIKSKPDYPKQENEHNALDDARWNRELHKFLTNL